MINLKSKEIAEALGISPSTVSRVLNNKGNISEKTRNLVIDYINSHYEISNSINPETNRKKNRIIGMVVGKIDNEFFAKVIKDLQASLTANGFLLSIANSNYSYDIERQSILSFVENEVECIVVLATRHSTITREELQGIPIIAIDDSNPLIDDSPDYTITSDQYIGGVLATEELIKSGCKKIAYFTNVATSQTAPKFKGYLDTLKKYDIPFHEELYITSGAYSSNTIEDAKNIIRYLIAKNIEFDGIFTTSDRRALGCLIALQENGIKCPDKVKVVGYDASSLANSFQITSIAQDISAIASNCYLCIMNLLNEGTNAQKVNTLIPVYLFKGITTL